MTARQGPPTALDTSVVIAALSPWHEAHEQAVQAVSPETRIPAHVLTETFATLTRMPEPYRLSADVVADYLDRQWANRVIVPGPDLYDGLPRRAALAGVSGGSTYDALVGLTAHQAGCLLVSLDVRAAPTYRALGIDYRLLARN